MLLVTVVYFFNLYFYLNRNNIIDIIPDKEEIMHCIIEIIAEANLHNLHIMSLERLFYKINTNINNQNNYNKMTIYYGLNDF